MNRSPLVSIGSHLEIARIRCKYRMVARLFRFNLKMNMNIKSFYTFIIVCLTTVILFPTSTIARTHMGTINIKVGETKQVFAEESTYYTVSGSWSISGGSSFSITARSQRSCTIRGVKAGTATLNWTGYSNAVYGEMYWTVNVSGDPEPIYNGTITMNVGDEKTLYQNLPSGANVNSSSWFLREKVGMGWYDFQENYCLKIVSKNSQSCTIKGLASSGEDVMYELHCLSDTKQYECYWTIVVKSSGDIYVHADPVGGSSLYPRKVPKGTIVYLTAKVDNNVVSDAKIYYTTDGKMPDPNSKPYTSAGITINGWTYLQAKAYKDGYSPVGDGWYYDIEDMNIDINATNFPDTNFRNYLLSLDEGKDGKFSESEISKLYSITVSSKNISSLKGIEYFAALKFLSCYDNKLTVLDVSKNIALEYLECYNNELTALDVSSNTKLITLDCKNNQLASLDVSKNVDLKKLDCGNNVTYINGVRLEEGNNQIRILNVLNNPALKSLSCQGNQLSSLDVSNNPLLSFLSCSRNQLTSLDVSKNTALTELVCGNNKLASLDISKNSALTRLSCVINQIKEKAMDILIQGLPVNKTNTIYPFLVYNPIYPNEGNVFTNAQATAVKAKGWTPECYDGSGWVECDGHEPPIPDDVTLTAKSYTRVYGDANPTFEYTVSGGTITSGKPTITCSATEKSPVGTYDIVISKGSVSNGTVNLVKGTLTITKAPLTVKASNYTRQEGEENPSFTLFYEGFKNGETEAVLTQKPVATTTATKSSSPGFYLITVSGGSAKNYEFNYIDGILTIIPQESSIAINSTNFPDGNFRNYLFSQSFGKDGELTEEEIKGVTKMDLNSINISSLKGIEHFFALKALYCSDNQLTTLDVSNNKNVTDLRCAGNQIKGVEMDNLIQSLPMNVTNEERLFGVIYSDREEGNYCTKDQVAMAKAKGWTPKAWNGKNWVEYEGAIKGDVFEDKKVNGTDLVALTNIILGRSPKKPSADVSGDGDVNGADYVALANIILRKASGARQTVTGLEAIGTISTLNVKPFCISAGETKEIIVELTNPYDELTLLQFDITLPEGLSINKVGEEYEIGMGGRTTWQSHQLAAYDNDNAIRCLLASNSNALIEGKEGTAVRLTVTASNDFVGGSITLHNILGVTPTEREVWMSASQYDLSTDGVTGIYSTGMDSTNSEIFSLSGQRQTILKKGVNIVNGKKVIMK